MSAPTVNVALVEDHDATRAGLSESLGDYGSRVQIVHNLATAEAYLEAVLRDEVDVALVDLGLPGMSGIELIRKMGTSTPGVRALALTVFEDEDTVVETIRAGAYGFLLKDEPVERLVQAIEEAAVGEHPISSRVAGFLFRATRDTPPPVTLSDREEQLAELLAVGKSYSECAEAMAIAIGTVQDYVKRLYRKLDVNSKKEVRAWVARHIKQP